MSDHEVEDLVEQSIRALDSCHPAADDVRVRDWIGALYRFQDRFDCSFTRFRVREILLRRGFTFRFRREAEENDDSGWPEDGHLAPDPPFVHCDRGSALWHRMVRTGRLTGPDAVPLREIPLVEVLQAVAAAGEQLGDPTLIADWREVEPTLCDVYDLGV